MVFLALFSPKIKGFDFYLNTKFYQRAHEPTDKC